MARKQKRCVANGIVKQDIRIEGKVVLITGANAGIGYETALDLAKRGAKILLACRNLEKAEEAKRKITEAVPNSVVLVKKLDLASVASIRECARNINDTEEKLDILINNAGIGLVPRCLTEDGFEMQLGVNHIGHFLLTNLLLDLLKRSSPSRIVIVSSLAYRFGEMKWNDMMLERDYCAFRSYSNSKLANILHCHELSKRLKGSGVTCNVLHPGSVATGFDRNKGDMQHFSFYWRTMFRILLPFIYLTIITPKMGAQTTIYCAVAPELDGVSGKYFNKCAAENVRPLTRRADDAIKLWNLSEKWTQKNGKAGDVNSDVSDEKDDKE